MLPLFIHGVSPRRFICSFINIARDILVGLREVATNEE
jgi:hypothetical protein